MLKLKAIYRQTENNRWDAHIATHPYISVVQADDFETARVILQIITAEEIGQGSKRRVNWDIVEEHITYNKPDKDTMDTTLLNILGAV